MKTTKKQSGRRTQNAERSKEDPRACLGPAVLDGLTAEAADEALGRMLADEINFALVAVAADPRARFPRGSLAAGVKQVFRKHRSSVRKGSADRAQSLLRLPPKQQQRLFGAFTGSGNEALSRKGLRASPALSGLLDRIVGSRVREFNSWGSIGGRIAGQIFGPSRTTVEAVRGLGGDMPQVLGHEISMVGSPDYIGFRWNTSEPDAEALRWELFELGSVHPISSGVEGPAPHGTFVIDFKDHLPPQPGNTPRRYVLRCQPWIQRKIHHIGGAGPGGGSVVKEPAQPAGAPAPIIRIVYAKDESSTEFNFAEVYRNLDLYTDSITMIVDQTGGGDEEFWITGVVQEVSGAGTAQEGLGPLLPLRTKYIVLAPEEGARENFSDVPEHRFKLNNPDAPPTGHQWWPRTYIVTLTVWEEDGGDEVADFISDLSSMLNDYLENDWADTVVDVLESLGIELTPLQVNQLTAILYAASAGTIVGIATAAVGFVLATIVADFADDYYGTRSVTLRLPSSEAELIHGLLVDGKSGYRLADGSWRFATDVLEFKGQPGANSAAGFDGLVELRLHWEASERQVWT